MKRPRFRSLARPTLLCASVLCLVAIALPTHTDAQSFGTLVFVGQDDTAQILATCTRGGQPCPAGSVHGILISTMPLVEAQREQRPYIALSATHDEVDRFFQQAYPAPRLPQTPPAGISPESCPSQSTDNWSGNIFGGFYTVWTTYWGNVWCTAQVSAISDRESWNSGHGIWEWGPNLVFDAGTQRAYDNANGCIGLGPTYQFTSATWTPHPGSDYTSVDFWAGSGCNPWDNSQVVNFNWY